jgi:hypothetical protein
MLYRVATHHAAHASALLCCRGGQVAAGEEERKGFRGAGLAFALFPLILTVRYALNCGLM